MQLARLRFGETTGRHLIKHSLRSYGAFKPGDHVPSHVGTTKDEVLNNIRALFASVGEDMYDPSTDVTQTEHALQAASQAEEYGAHKELIAAALLHDVGHMLLGNKDGKSEFLDEDRDHETVNFP